MSDYNKVSKQLTDAWQIAIEGVKDADICISEMLAILETEGYARDAAINKMVEDHQHLKGFSRRTIYRNLPQEEKRQYLTQTKPETSKKSNVSNDTIYASDTPVELKEAKSLGEVVSYVEKSVRELAEEVQPPLPEESDRAEPEQPPSQHDDKPTDEPEAKLPKYLRLELTRLVPGTTVTFAKKLDIIMHAGAIAYFTELNGEIIGVESAGEYLRKQSQVRAVAL